MKVSELAKQMKTTEAAVLDKLRSLKLKAKDGNQELNRAVATVLKSEIMKDLKLGSQKKTTVKKEPPAAAKAEVPVEKVKTKKVKAKEEEKGKKEPEAKAPAKKTPAGKLKAAEPEKEKKAAKPGEESKPEKKPAQKEAPASPEPVQEKPKPKPVKKKISDAPFIPLKPLLKKKKRPAGRDKAPAKGEDKGPVVLSPVEASGAGLPSGQVVGQDDPGAEHLPKLEVKLPVNVKDLAVRLQQKTSVVMKKLMQLGFFVTINQSLGEGVVRRIVREFGFNLTEIKTQEEQLIEDHQSADEDPSLLTPRAPVVTLMGHVDHGKTSLLDRIRKSQVVDQEHGGITQHMGAYSVKLPKGRITFLDTPGHEAFTAMRARGAHITDLVILVVAADEGIKPQTEEAIDHARAADVPIVVALNKIDRKNADPDRVKKELADHGLNPEDWGGNTIVVGVSAVTGEGVDSLLEMIILEAEMLELKANANKPASGIVVEAHLSKGKGAVTTLIVQGGTLKLNEFMVVGPHYGKVKAMFDDKDLPIQEAGPSMPVELLGLPDVPEAGEMFYVVGDEKQAREISLTRSQQLKDKRLASSQRVTLEDLYQQIQEGSIKELNVILKADVQGSLEALKDSLEKIPSDEVKVKFIHTGVGDINASDVLLAVVSNAIIIGFHVAVGPRAKEELEKQPVDVREYRIIYDAVNDMRKALEGLLEPKTRKKFMSRIEVRQVFKLSKSGLIAGCFVVKGKVTRKAKVDVQRDGEVVFSGAISSLKRFKDDVREVNEGYECGISIDGFEEIQEGDILETYELETIVRKL